MKNKIAVLAFLFFLQMAFSQKDGRKPFHGQVMNDSIKVEHVVVFNANSKTGVLINKEGGFDLNVKEKDTLVFSSLQFKTKKVVLTAKQIKEQPLVVALDLYVYQLDEVHIDTKPNPIKGSTQVIVDKQYTSDDKSSPAVKNVYDGQTQNGIDFVRLYKDVMKSLKVKNPSKTSFMSDEDFTRLVMQKVHYSFFTDDLNLKEEQVRLFLVYCENDPEAQKILKNESDFELMDFLISKKNEFQKLINK